MSKKTEAGSIWTPSNIITLLRICLVPVFVVALLSPWPEWFGLNDVIDNGTKSLVAAGVFIFISCTDWLDGYLARKRDEVTDFGKFIDPLADKILVAAALLALVQLQVLPSWPVLIILAREFIVSGIRMIAASKNMVIAASWYGKAKTVAQIIAIVLFLVKDSLYLPNVDTAMHSPLYLVSWAVMIVALILTIVSMLDYISKARYVLGFASTANPSTVNGGGADVPTDGQLLDLAAEVVGKAASSRITIACAESLTGGMISSCITAIPGSSEVFKGGIVSYTFFAKSELLGVDSEFLARFGAVNADTAIQMAKGASMSLDSDLSVAVTGIAGPGGAEEGKPVGTVYISDISSGGTTNVSEMHFAGNRDDIRRQTTYKALQILVQNIDGASEIQ